MFTPQLRAAIVRALIGAAISAAIVGLGALQQGASTKTVIVTAGGAFVSYLAYRAAAEGFYDSNRAATGNVKPADVGAQFVGR